MRLLIISTLDSKEPFGAFTRPFYLGKYLSEYFEVFQLGLDCSAVDYAQSMSVGNRGLSAYKKAIRDCVASFKPDLVYAQETLPAMAALLTVGMTLGAKIPLVFDFHTLSAFEYWTRLPSASNQLKEFKQFIKTYIAQGLLVFSGNPIIAAGRPVFDLINAWYPGRHPQVHAVGNGVPEDLMEKQDIPEPEMYRNLRPAKVVIVTAPKTFSFPTNDMSVSMTLDIARHLEGCDPSIHLVIVGRDGEGLGDSLPNNVSFAGFLPQRQDFLAYLHHADVALLPFSKQAVAGGARNKALDYFASQKLVVSTPEGMRGLEEFEDRKHLLITGYEPEEIADTIQVACVDTKSFQPLVSESFNLIKTKYSWTAMAEKIAKVLSEHSKSFSY